MKTDIHPTYAEATIACSCGHSVTTRSTKADLHVEICSNCHPFYTGKQKLMDTGGRLGRFQAKLEAAGSEDAPARKGKKANVRTFTPAVDPKVLAAKAARAEAKALEDAKKKQAAEEAEVKAREEKKLAREAAEAQAVLDAKREEEEAGASEADVVADSDAGETPPPAAEAAAEAAAGEGEASAEAAADVPPADVASGDEVPADA